MTKYLFTSLVVLFSAGASAQLSAAGTVTVYPLEAEPKKMMVSISGPAAGAIYNSMSVPPVDLGSSSLTSIVQKIGKNISCVRTRNWTQHSDSFRCELTLIDGAAGVGASG